MMTVTRQQYFTALAQLGDMNLLFQAIPADTNSDNWIEFWSAEYITLNDPISVLTQASQGWTDLQMIALFNAASLVPVVDPSAVVTFKPTVTRQQFFTALVLLGNMNLLYQAVPASADTVEWVEFWTAEYITFNDPISVLTQASQGWTEGQMIALFTAAQNVPIAVPSTSNTITSTANGQINGALRLLGVLAEGETPSAETSQDALFALNQMIDSWNTERLAVFSTQDQVFTWPAGELRRTLGPSGDFRGNRPVLLDDATYFRDPQTNVSYGIKIINQQQYDGIAVKTVTSTYPQVIWVNMTYPNIEMYVYPKPLRQLEWHFVSVEELSNPATLGTTLAFPPGYLRAFRYNLACELAPEFGVEPSAQVQRIAMYSKRNLKRINNPDDIMALPYSIVGTRQRYNIYAGNY